MLSRRLQWCKRSRWLGLQHGDLHSIVRNLLQWFLGDPQHLHAVIVIKNGRRGADALCADVNLALPLASRLGCFDQCLHSTGWLVTKRTSCLMHAHILSARLAFSLGAGTPTQACCVTPCREYLVSSEIASLWQEIPLCDQCSRKQTRILAQISQSAWQHRNPQKYELGFSCDCTPLRCLVPHALPDRCGCRSPSTDRPEPRLFKTGGTSSRSCRRK
jgi:hypothetical protein